MKRSFFSLLVGVCVAVFSVTAFAGPSVVLDGKYVSATATSSVVFVVPDLNYAPNVADAFRPAPDAAVAIARRPLDARAALGLAAKNRTLAFVDERHAGRATVPKRWLS